MASKRSKVFSESEQKSITEALSGESKEEVKYWRCPFPSSRICIPSKNERDYKNQDECNNKCNFISRMPRVILSEIASMEPKTVTTAFPRASKAIGSIYPAPTIEEKISKMKKQSLYDYDRERREIERLLSQYFLYRDESERKETKARLADLSTKIKAGDIGKLYPLLIRLLLDRYYSAYFIRGELQNVVFQFLEYVFSNAIDLGFINDVAKAYIAIGNRYWQDDLNEGLNMFIKALSVLQFSTIPKGLNNISEEEKIRILKNLLRSEPKENRQIDISNIYYWLGLLDQRKYNIDQAIEEYSKAISLSPTNLNFLSSRADLYYFLNEDKKALEDYKRIRALDPNYPTRILNIYIDSNDYKGQIEEFTKDKDYLAASIAYSKIGDYKNALKFVMSNVYFPSKYLQEAKIFAELKDFDKLLEVLRKYDEQRYPRERPDIDESNTRAEILKLLGMIDSKYMDAAKKQYEISKSITDEYIRDEPDESEYYEERAEIWKELGNSDEASKDYNTALRIITDELKSKTTPPPDLDISLLYRQRAQLLEKMNDYSSAIRDYDQAIRYDPYNRDARKKLKELTRKITIVGPAISSSSSSSSSSYTSLPSSSHISSPIELTTLPIPSFPSLPTSSSSTLPLPSFSFSTLPLPSSSSSTYDTLDFFD